MSTETEAPSWLHRGQGRGLVGAVGEGDLGGGLDGLGVPGRGDTGMSDVTVYLDIDGDGVPDRYDFTARTDVQGRCVFESVPPGTYTLRQVPPRGYVQTTPSFDRITIAGSELVGMNFGNSRRPDLARSSAPYEDVSDLDAGPGRRPGEPVGREGEFDRWRSSSEGEANRASGPPHR